MTRACILSLSCLLPRQVSALLKPSENKESRFVPGPRRPPVNLLSEELLELPVPFTVLVSFNEFCSQLCIRRYFSKVRKDESHLQCISILNSMPLFEGVQSHFCAA